jgi:transketolase
MELAQANLEVFSATLLELARENPDLLVVTSDSRGSAKLAPFAKAVPGQIVEVGIAEQNLVGGGGGVGRGRQDRLCGLAGVLSDRAVPRAD